MHATIASTTAARPTRTFSWRVVDIVVASVVAVASGVIFWAWGIAWTPISAPVTAALPGLQGILERSVALRRACSARSIIRKPGAAIFTELVAADRLGAARHPVGCLTTLLSGLVQGLGAEIVFALFLYANWRLYVALIAGAGAGLAESVLDLIVSYPGAKPEFAIIYTISTTVSGVVIAGSVRGWSCGRSRRRVRSAGSPPAAR